MRSAKYLLILTLILALAVPAMAQRRRERIVDPGALLSSAKIAMRANPPRYDEAMDYLNEVLEIGPNPQAYFFRGNIYGEWANQEYDLTKKLDLLTKMQASYDSMKVACENKDIKRKFRKDCDEYIGLADSVGVFNWRENYNNAVQVIGRIDERYVPDVRNATDSTQELRAVESLQAAADTAINYFKLAITVDSADFRPYEGIGIVYDRLRNQDSAAFWFVRAHDVAPDSIRIVQNAAYAYIQDRQWEKALEWFRKYSAMVPEDASALSNMAIIFNNMQMFDSAYKYNRLAVEIDSTMSGAYFDIGQYFLLKSQTVSDSIKSYQQADNKEKAQEFIAARDAMLDTAANYYENALKYDSLNVAAIEQFGVVTLVGGQYEKARTAFEMLTELEPFRKDHWINLGDVLIQMGQFEQAIPAFEKASEVDPGDIKLWETLGDLYESNGYPEKAKEARAKAEELKNI